MKKGFTMRRRRQGYSLVLASLGAALVLAGTPVSAQPCGHDCNGDGAVTVDEVNFMITLALTGGTAGCAFGDGDADGRITVDEILLVVNAALSGCF